MSGQARIWGRGPARGFAAYGLHSLARGSAACGLHSRARGFAADGQHFLTRRRGGRGAAELSRAAAGPRLARRFDCRGTARASAALLKFLGIRFKCASKRNPNICSASPCTDPSAAKGVECSPPRLRVPRDSARGSVDQRRQRRRIRLECENPTLKMAARVRGCAQLLNDSQMIVDRLSQICNC